MGITDAELAYVKSSGIVIFKSIQGEIDVHSIQQHVDFPQAANAHIQFVTVAAKPVTFSTAACDFHTLTVSSGGGIVVPHDLSTSDGNMALTASSANLALSANADLISAGTLSISGSGTTTIANNAIFDAVGDISIATAVTISAGVFIARTNTSMTISNDITSSGIVELYSNCV
jgi:hypothetical protein